MNELKKIFLFFCWLSYSYCSILAANKTTYKEALIPLSKIKQISQESLSYHKGPIRITSVKFPLDNSHVQIIAPFSILKRTGLPVTAANLIEKLNPQVLINGGRSRSIEFPIPAGGLIIDYKLISDFRPEDSLWPSVVCITAKSIKIQKVAEIETDQCQYALQTGVDPILQNQTSSKDQVVATSGICLNDKFGYLFQTSEVDLATLGKVLQQEAFSCTQAALFDGKTQSGMYIKSHPSKFLGSKEMTLPSALMIP